MVRKVSHFFDQASIILCECGHHDLRPFFAYFLGDPGQTFCNVDVSQEEPVKNLVEFTVKTYGRLDVAINNAALTPDDKPIADFDLNYWNRLLAVDLTGVALCMKYEIRQMMAQGGGGSIVNVSSVSGVRPQPANPAYIAAKPGITPRPSPSWSQQFPSMARTVRW